MPFIIQLESKYKFSIRRAVENELINLKGRVKFDKLEYNIEPSSYIIEKIKELEDVLDLIKTSRELLRLEDGQTLDLVGDSYL